MDPVVTILPVPAIFRPLSQEQLKLRRIVMALSYKFVIATLFVSMGLAGCVSMGKYELKEKEADEISRSLKDLQQNFADLNRENSGLKARSEKLDVDMAALAKDNESLKADKAKLNDLLRARPDDLTKEIEELRRSCGELEMQNEKLKMDMAALQKSKTEEAQKTSKTYEEMLEKMKNEIARGEVAISELKGELSVKMLDSVLFESKKAEVKPEGELVLRKIVDVLKSVKNKAIRIEGHTDNVQITGLLADKYPSNWEFSAARAVNVTRHLQQQGINPSMLSAVAYGEYHPAASNDNDEGKARNRRIELVLFPKDAP
jgi:chemotaxis protein MotB